MRRGRAPCPGSPEDFLSSISHDDAATAAAAALDVPAGVYNVVDDEPLTRREYFDSLAKALASRRRSLPAEVGGALLGSVGEILARSLRISNRKLKSVVGWTPTYPSVREGWPPPSPVFSSRGSTAAQAG